MAPPAATNLRSFGVHLQGQSRGGGPVLLIAEDAAAIADLVKILGDAGPGNLAALAECTQGIRFGNGVDARDWLQRLSVALEKLQDAPLGNTRRRCPDPRNYRVTR